MRSVVERNPFVEAPMEPFRVATMRFILRVVVCLGLIAFLILLLRII